MCADLAGGSVSIAVGGVSVLAGLLLRFPSGTGLEGGMLASLGEVGWSARLELTSGDFSRGAVVGSGCLVVEGSSRRMSSLVTSLSLKMRSHSTPIECELVQ